MVAAATKVEQGVSGCASPLLWRVLDDTRASYLIEVRSVTGTSVYSVCPTLLSYRSPDALDLLVGAPLDELDASEMLADVSAWESGRSTSYCADRGNGEPAVWQRIREVVARLEAEIAAKREAA